MFRSITIKSFFRKKTFKRFTVFFILVLVIWLLLIALSIYFESHHSKVVSLDDFSLSFPDRLNIIDSQSTTVVLQYREYTSKNNDLWISFPQAFQIREEIFEGRDIIYHLEITDGDGIHGYVQIWQLDSTMLDFLNNAKKFRSDSIYDFSEKEIAFGNNIKGYKWSYTVKGVNGDTIARQAFLSRSGSNKMYVFSLYIPKSEYSESFESMYDNILYSVKFR